MPVIRQLSFELMPGRILGVVGESGAGKSMIGNAIAHALPPGFSVTSGSLLLDNEDLVHLAPARRRALLGRDIAFIAQEPMTALNPVLTIGAQFNEHLRRLSIAERRERALQLLDAVHLRDGAALLRRYPHQLSGGMCQRVLIAMAFAGRPRLIVADEPTTALDVTIQARIVQLIAELQHNADTSVLFITHDLRLASRICDDILVLYSGRAVEQGRAGQLLAEPAHPYTRCLQLASPTISGKRSVLAALPDRMPGLLEAAALQGCRFAPRCPIAQNDCAATDPPDHRIGASHQVACHHSERTRGIAVTAAPDVPAVGGGAPLLRLDDVGKQFRAGWRSSGTWAVRATSFTIDAGEFVGLVGESGSGKSTLARLIMGLERTSTGTIMLGARDVTHATQADARHRLHWAQMVFQDTQSALNPRRRVGDIVTQTLQAGRHAIRRAQRMDRARVLLAEVGLPAEFVERYPAQLSGGQRQRVNIARALCAAPRLLVADEIVSGLDVSVQAQLLALLQRLRAELGIALLFISHDLSVVRHLCERVLVMHQGAIVEQGPTERVFAAPRDNYTRRLLAAVPPDDPAQPWRPFPDEAETTPAAVLPRAAAAAPSG
ncbi:MAG TPA: ABC transporter ATP-binding protein [Acetobacteraceae bacterium]|nr:ABC transporter ATP-binding protein [Acetobacteraceae bacterium]